MKTSIIQLEPNDDIISARDKMTWSKSPRILIVWPSRGKLLRRRIDLVLLKRQGEELGAQLALVTHDRAVALYARELGLPIFPKMKAAQQYAWPSLSVEKMKPERKPVDPSQLRAEGERFHPAGGGLLEKTGLRLAVFTLAVLSVLVLVMFFYPSARLVISPAQKTQSADLEVSASPRVRSAGLTGGIPVRQVTVVVEGRQEVDSTGTTRVANQYATGKIQLANLTASEVMLPEGTILRTMDDPPVRFQTLVQVTLPAGPGKTAEVEARAFLPGTAGNVAAGKIQSVEGDVSLLVSVTNPEPFSGGTEQASLAPDEDDYQRARDMLLKALEQPARDDLERMLPSGQVLIPAYLRVKEIQKETSLPAVGQPGDRLRLTMQVEFSSWQIASSDLVNVAMATLDASLPGGYMPLPETLTIQPLTQPVMAGSDTAHWKVRAQRVLRAYRPTDEIVGDVQGRPVSQAVRVLKERLPMQNEPQVLLSPSWWFWMPSLPFRIEVVTQ